MIGSDMLTSMKFRLNRLTNGSTELDNLIYSEMNAAQVRLEGAPILPWFLTSEEAYFDVTVDEERAELPLDFLREIETENLRVQDLDTGTFYNDLIKGFLDESRRRFPGTGRPKRYVVSGMYIRLFPIPDKAYRIWMSYSMKQDEITADSENLWQKYMPDLIMAEAGIPLATSLRNDGALALFTSLGQNERDRLMRESTAREQENFDPNPED